MEGRPRILLIDDDDGLRRVTQRALGRRGFVVTTAAGGADGLALMADAAFDVVAVDHHMPGMDGLATLAAIRALPAPPPVVYVTGSEDGRIAMSALRAGAAAYIVKTVGDEYFDLLADALATTHQRTVLEAEVRESNTRLAALLHEVNHRVANSLQLVSAFVQLQSAALADDAARAALDATQRRIEAIGQVHRRLYTSNDVEGVDMADYLAALVAELGQAWSITPDRRISVAIEPMRLPTDRAVSVGVIVNELVTNACKYAYDSAAPGEVRVALRREGHDRFALAVEDDGCGIDAAAAPRGTGLGTRLVRTMARSLQSAVAYEDVGPGTRAVLVAAIR